MKDFKLFLLFVFTALLFSNFSCEKEPEPGKVTYLSYGTSFGECLGYCIREVVVGGNIVFTKRGWTTGEELPDSSCSYTFIRDPLPDYLDDINLQTFLEMEETIGCPDCADGGAEWLELGFEDLVKRVTFEYGKEPEEFKNIIPDLRELMEGFNDCRN